MGKGSAEHAPGKGNTVPPQRGHTCWTQSQEGRLPWQQNGKGSQRKLAGNRSLRSPREPTISPSTGCETISALWTRPVPRVSMDKPSPRSPRIWTGSRRRAYDGSIPKGIIRRPLGEGGDPNRAKQKSAPWGFPRSSIEPSRKARPRFWKPSMSRTSSTARVVAGPDGVRTTPWPR